MFLPWSVFSQNSFVDSLEQIINDQSAPHSEKQLARLDIAINLLRINPEKSKKTLLEGRNEILENGIKNPNASILDFNYYLAILSYFDEEYDVVHEYLDENEKLIPKSENQALHKVRLFSRRGLTYAEQGELGKAISFLNKSYEIALREHDNRMLLLVTNQLSKFYNKHRGRRDSAIYYTLESSKYFENDKNSLAITYMNIALMNLDIQKDSIALEYYLKTLELKEQTLVPLIPVLAAKGAGILYRDQSDYETSSSYFIEALEESQNLENKREMHLILLEQGILYKLLGRKKDAIKSIEKALDFFMETKDVAASNFAMLNLSEICYEKEREMSKSLYEKTKGFRNYSSLSIREQKRAHLIQSELGNKYKDYENAFKATASYNEIIRKENEEGKALIASQYQEGYEAELNAKIKFIELEKLKEESEKLKLNYLFYGLGLPLLIALIGLFYNYSRQREFEEDLKIRSKSLEVLNKNLEAKNEELNSFAYISSHDLKTPLISLIGFTQLISEELKEKSIESDSIAEYLKYIESSSIQMQNLLDNILVYARLGNINIKDETTPVDLRELLNDIIVELKTEFKKPIEIEYTSDIDVIEANKKILKLFFKSMIHNGLLFNDSKTSTVKIAIKKEKTQPTKKL